MAIKQEIEIEVTEEGLDSATSKVNALSKATNAADNNAQALSRTMQGSANSVLENGGAIGLLDEATGGYATKVKDAVEASALFTKSQKAAALMQAFYTTVVGASTGAMKIFRIALVSTGIGAIVVGLGLLIANFDKVKKVVLNLVPGLKIIGDIFMTLVQAVTDFIGVTSDATRALDKMVEDAEASLKRNEFFLEANGDKFDQYTQRKLKANIDYNKKVKELAADEELTTEEKLSQLKAFRDKADREILKADSDRETELDKRRKEAADKISEQNKKLAEEAKKHLEEQKKRELEELERQKKLREEGNSLFAKAAEEDLNREIEAEIKKNETLAALKEETDLQKLEKQREADLEILNQANATQQEILDLNLAYDEKVQALDAERLANEKIKAEERKVLEQSVASAKVDIASRTLSLINEIAGEGSKIGKGIAVAQATISGIEGTQNAFTTASKSPITTLFPAYPFIQAGLAGAFSLLQVKKILSTDPSGKTASVPSGGTGITAPAAPSFNLVQGTGANQIANAVSGRNNQPIKAYTVAQDQTTAAALDRNIIQQSTL